MTTTATNARLSTSALCRAVAPYTLIAPDLLTLLHALSRDVRADGIVGDLVECGVANGGSAAVIGEPHTTGDTADRRLWLYDTWEGIPPATERDGHLAQSHTGAWRGSQERVREALAVVDYPLERVEWRRGLFADTMANAALPERVALLHLDCDWYESVLLCLRTLAPRVTAGGSIVLDDFGWWKGCREAFFQWCAETGQAPLLERAGKYGAWWEVGRESNVPGREMT